MATNATSDDESHYLAIADKSLPVAIVLGIILSPVAYYYVGRTKLAVINFFTLNYLMLGLLLVPIHVYKIISGARSREGGKPAGSSL
ncbi:hypothetical protein [Halostagnicola kamekurae]|uniref:Uncharacterized protein n=1 Tax=Halostagnicola kamekurae TaxID=619731 RepID=A0A1I6QP66_9EURY|nr:hypothetical protein [Halostagnicola kamekurae]SFS54267.1 hypothetical protein SAMN04488556_1421 [Halostagnicola kamekurae]